MQSIKLYGKEGGDFQELPENLWDCFCREPSLSANDSVHPAAHSILTPRQYAKWCNLSQLPLLSETFLGSVVYVILCRRVTEGHPSPSPCVLGPWSFQFMTACVAKLLELLNSSAG